MSRPLAARTTGFEENTPSFLALGFLICLPLILNPGYFSHDELQWLAFADKSSLRDVPWIAWFDFSPFQYRPLTFNLWLLLSHFVGYQPILMHLARVLFGLLAAWLLRSVLLQLRVAPRRASIACWFWLLMPYTVYTHGWVGTFGDSLCLIFMLMALLHVLQQPPQPWRQSAVNALPVAALTALALMSKESAVVIPAAMLIAVLRRRDRVGVAAFAASAVIVLIYLGLRLQTILYPHVATGSYRWSLANIPGHLADYTVFPFLVGHFEVIAARTHLANWPALLCLLILTTVLASAGRRRCGLFWLGWIFFLGPVLILDDAYNQYGYLAGAWAYAFFAWTWGRIPAALRAFMLLPIAMTLAHSVQQVREVRHVGVIQYNLYTDLVPLLARGSAPIQIAAQDKREIFILRRLLTDIPSYRHIPVASRVTVVPPSVVGISTDYIMINDGHLARVE